MLQSDQFDHSPSASDLKLNMSLNRTKFLSLILPLEIRLLIGEGYLLQARMKILNLTFQLEIRLPIGQGSLLQACVSEFPSPQSFPLNCGSGFVQVLVRV